MRNMGLKNSNYCMTVVGVAPPLYVTRKILYVCVGILNSLIMAWKDIFWHSGSWN